MGAWLYAPAKGGDHYFQDRRNKHKKVDVSFENFRDYIATGLIDDRDWGVKFNFTAIEPNDELFIYIGDHGIIGYARVMEKHEKHRKFLILDFDKDRTRALLQSPVSPKSILPLINNQRPRTVVNLSPCYSKLRKLLPWETTR
jgi:hypothetical protein